MKISNLFKGDIVIWMVFFLLCVISVVEVFSASSTLAYKSHDYIRPILYHSGTIVGGVIVILAVQNMPCKYFKYFILPSLFLALLGLILVHFMGTDVNGATRQMSLLGISIQPSEIAKLAMVLVVAQILNRTQQANGASSKAMKYILWVAAPYVLLILTENLSSAVLLCITLFMMMVIGRVPARQLLKLVGVCAGGVVVALLAILTLGRVQVETPTDTPEATETAEAAATAAVPKAEKADRGMVAKVFHRFDTWKGRIVKFTDSEEVPPEKYDIVDKDAQRGHANIAIVSSGIIGRGPGNSVERDFLSQAFSDFIFAIIIEELGILGASVVVMLYLILLFRTAQIANRCENSFPAFLAMGIALLLVVQATFNMCVAVGLAPITGQPLPLISKGGSATVINCIYIGMLLSISRTAKPKPAAQTLAQ